MAKKILPFIEYWFLSNKFTSRKGRTARCCFSCTHYQDAKECTDGTCEYCKLLDIQTHSHFVCEYHNWIKSKKSIWD
jgi:hypothetical protein